MKKLSTNLEILAGDIFELNYYLRYFISNLDLEKEFFNKIPIKDISDVFRESRRLFNHRNFLDRVILNLDSYEGFSLSTDPIQISIKEAVEVSFGYLIDDLEYRLDSFDEDCYVGGDETVEAIKDYMHKAVNYVLEGLKA